jgi:LPXTG-site transpeptidase (sortase) family protein
MKKRLTGLAVAFCLLAALALPAHAQDYNFTAPSAGDFGTPTSDDTIYEWTDPNVDRSKNSALIPPGFGTPSSYLPGFGEFLTPNLAAGGPLNGGNLIPGTVGTAPLPSAPGTGGSTGTGYPTVNYPTVGGPVTAFTELTPDLYYSDGSLGTLMIPSVGLTVKIYEGTGSAPLLKGAGHFTGTTAWDGNYCVAGHNRGVRNDFGKIHTLKTGDTINLTTPLGTRTYSVASVSKISYTDTSMLEATSDNCITLFTCVEDQPAYRWCVRAVAG